jgi:dynactin complex subunit
MQHIYSYIIVGIWIGIEFSQPVGRNDGTLQGVTYFGPLQPNHGLLML